ncbi:MAG TPA: hypothetical protein VKF40_10685 [Burkholderiales bacterium]|nr:hypothetical protein [Burkholderiales bacterium]
MHCWEFHHNVEAGTYQWFWRALNADGTLHSESVGTFASAPEAIADAKEHGFDREVHEWYMAPPNSHPCIKTVEEG